MLDYFDFLLMAFVLAFIVKDWHLTYGQSAAILLSSGVSAPLGSLIWGWVADKIGRRKVIIATILNFSIATGLMALTPDNGWIFLVVCRFLVGFGVTGLYTVDIAVVQEFVPASRRGWIPGVTTTMLPAGFILGAVLGQYLEAYVGWRSLFAIGLLPAGMSLLIHAWVPESAHWLIRVGRLEEARQSLAWALMVDPKEIQVPAVARPVEKVVWRELFKYPRSVAAGLSDRPERDRNHRVRIVASYAFRHGPACQPGGGFGPGNLVEPRTDRRALFLLVALGCDWAPHSDRADLRDRWRDNVAGWVLERPVPRRLLGLLFDDHGAAILRQRWLFDHWTVHGRDLAVAVARQRHGTGLRRRQSRQVHRSGWARGDRGSSNFVSPQATADALIPAMNYFAVWYALALVAVLFIGFETRGRTIGEIGSTLTARRSGAAAIKAPAAP